MTLTPQAKPEPSQANIPLKADQTTQDEKILCPHCQRTATNGIRCQGVCVADSDYYSSRH